MDLWQPILAQPEVGARGIVQGLGMLVAYALIIGCVIASIVYALVGGALAVFIASKQPEYFQAGHQTRKPKFFFVTAAILFSGVVVFLIASAVMAIRNDMMVWELETSSFCLAMAFGFFWQVVLTRFFVTSSVVAATVFVLVVNVADVLVLLVTNGVFP